MFLQDSSHDFPLYSDPAAVDDANLAKPALGGLIEIFLHDNVDLPRLKRVEVDGVLDWDVVHGESI